MLNQSTLIRRSVISILFLVCTVPAKAQDVEPPTLILNGFVDFPIKFKDANTDGYGIGAEYVLSPNWGILAEYSTFHVMSPRDFTSGRIESQVTVAGPSLFVQFHPALDRRFSIVAAAGLSYLNISFTQQPFVFGLFQDERRSTLVQAKFGFRLRLYQSAHAYVIASIHHLALAGLMVTI